ncbi:hypothetical protein CCACVL1_07724 [Corchorus capsularis]|uniref:Uncharacterized protein n=1 Tax=Corchorus capsularis TaxID=210143 RepID=A0A1R3J474_COCAP|nr:hypothetical protein CCACVL1_07724 [Corchorus capsularis]
MANKQKLLLFSRQHWLHWNSTEMLQTRAKKVAKSALPSPLILK